MTTTHRIRIGLITGAMLLILSACGSSTNDARPATDDVELTADGIVPDAGPSVDTPEISAATQILFEEADTRGDAPFAPDAEIAECQPEQLDAFLESEPRVASAWADAADVSSGNITETIRSYTPTVLTVDTRVTNHAYRSGEARGFQATLEAGTAVLVDDAGVPRVRCACGNPLAPPQPVDNEVIEDPPTQIPVTTTTAPPATSTQLDFCATWQVVGSSMVGGPSAPDELAMAEYFNTLVAGFDQLIAATTVTLDFPAEALADLIAYRDAIATAAITPGNPGPGPDDALLGARVEDFLDSYCGDSVLDETPSNPPTHLDGDDLDGDNDDAIPADGTSGNCGSMQFALLIMLADELGLEHAATSQPYVDAMQALVNGFDPGPEFDVSDLSLMLANEEIGCQGAQAMQQLLIASGYGPLIDGTELGA